MIQDYQDVMEKLREIDGVKSVKDGSTGRVTAVDFKIFELNRPTDTSNFVFGRFGTHYKNGLIRLPKVPKSEYTEKELRQKILRSIASPASKCVEIRFEPEVSLDGDYHYPHIEIHGDEYESIHIVEQIVENYHPPLSGQF